MEKFFKPVHSPSAPDEIKLKKHHHHHHHHHHHDPQSHRYTMFDDTDRNTDESHGHHRHHQHGHYVHDSPHRDTHHRHQTRQFHHSEEDEILYNHDTPVTLSRASSSSLSSSSSSSSSSWYTEASVNDPFSLRHAERPQHSLSCSNISDVRRGFQEDDSSEPVVFATIKHGSTGTGCSQSHGSSQQRGKCGFSPLDRGHSRSEEGLLQGNESDQGGEQSRVPHMNYGPLYKTASLNRSLAFSEEDIVLGVSRGPKRAVSSSQLPSKGILKNRDPRGDIRKAKSMEVLSPRVAKGQDPSGQKGKGVNQAVVAQARANFVQGKLQFSAFLDEITKQVISPSDLNILGVNKDKTTGKSVASAQTHGPVKPQLPPKKHRESSGEEREQHPKQHSRQEKAARNSSRKQSDCSNPDKLISYGARNHHGSPPPSHYPNSASHNTHHGSNRKDRRPSPTGSSTSGDRYGRCGPHLTDGTSTSPEPIQPKQRHHRKHQTTTSHSPHPHTQHFPQPQPHQAHPGPGQRGPSNSPPSSAQGAGPGPGSESSSCKSDSSRTRDTASTATSHSSEQSGRHHSQHVGHSKQHRDTLCDTDHLQALQEENADLHQNLLQTVVCIESLEAELQRTRDELSHVKEKYKSLLETHTGTKQANNLLGEHLHIASESLSSERKYLLNRVSQLSSELEDAHRTIAALENINVPCLIKDLLEKHFDSAEAIQKFLTTPTPISHSATSLQGDNQSHAPKVEETAHDWLTKEAGPQRVTAFMPFKQGVPTTGTEGCHSGQHDASHSPPFSVAAISTAIYKKMADSYAARPQPLYPQCQQQPSQGTNHTDAPPNLPQAHVGGDSWGGKGGVEVTLLEQDVVDVTSMTAQQILDDFLQQLQAHTEAGGGKEQQGGQQWAEQAGKVAD
ncbi:knob-associated histidine-rich protein [Thunnus thynnus]|uniref:knob-associated histidine-rich protein n=1 Tax=Thunnus thynnus TaxID=8237 RepID=UPI0035285356